MMIDGSRPAPGILLNRRLPQHRDGNVATPVITPKTTPTTSPERKRQNERNGYGRHRLFASRTPAAIDLSTSELPHSNRGHQFTVGNISNGMIYLRPIIRPAHELHHNYVLPPSTPPSSAEEREERRHPRQESKHGPQPSPPRTPTGTAETRQENKPVLDCSPPLPRTRHHRSYSYSRVNEQLGTARETDFGRFQVKIDQVDGPDEPQRPYTAGHQASFQSLDVQIPHYNLGSPRFSPNGTPFLYGSSSLNVASTQGEPGSSHASQHADMRWLLPRSDPLSLSPSAVSNEITASIVSAMASRAAVPQFSSISVPAPQTEPTVSEVRPKPLVSSPIVVPRPQQAITSDIYDQLSFPPASEDPSIVRYDPQTKEILAAVPGRIIAQITSAAFVDYHLLSDFFLTYRLFMNASDLAAYLVSRLRWAISRGDDTGKVVRVRTFVAIRHWLLNYFADDFVPSLPFREQFASSLNELYNSVRAEGKFSDLKIIGELKKCWRRTCALYWDSAANNEADPEQDIAPGGPPGERAESLRPRSSLLRMAKMTPPPRLGSVQPDDSSGTESFIRDVIQPLRITKGTTNIQTVAAAQVDEGMSISTKSSQPHDASHALKPENMPLDPRKKSPSVQESTLTPAKRLRPSPHKRSGSFSDALRDDRQPLPQLPNSLAKTTHLFMTLPYSTSLVRGNLFPPTPAFVEVIAPATPIQETTGFQLGLQSGSSTSSAVMLCTPDRQHPNGLKVPSGPGMKKILGSVRRALSGRAAAPPPPTMNGKGSPIPTARIARSTEMRSNTSLSGKIAAHASASVVVGMSGDGRAARVDLLGAGAIAAFQRAMEEETFDEKHEYDAVASSEKSAHEEVTRVDGAIDGAVDGRTDIMVELGSRDSYAGKTAPETSVNGDDFLDSPSTANPPEEFYQASAEISFLADKTEPTISSRNSIEASDNKTAAISPPPRSPQLLRRSKSFSFERSPSRLNHVVGNIDERSNTISPLSAVEVRSLHSARSFSLKRVNSTLSHYMAMDDISETFSEHSSLVATTEDSTPNRMLRRRPGGNLRAAATIGELELPRPKSAGSIGTGTFSFDDGIHMAPFHRIITPLQRSSSTTSGPKPITKGILSLGAVATGAGVADQGPPVSEPKDRTSQEEKSCHEEDVKASFAEGIQGLRDIPDDESDDGGVAVALAKLEGTYQRKKSGETSPMLQFRNSSSRPGTDFESSMVVVSNSHDRGTAGYDGVDEWDSDNEHHRRLKRRHKQVVDHVPLETPPILDRFSEPFPLTRTPIAREESEDSVPILERGLSINLLEDRKLIKRPGNPIGRLDGSSGQSEATPNFSRPSRPSHSSPPSEVDLRRLDSELARHMEERKKEARSSELSSEISFEMIQPKSENIPRSEPPIQPGANISELLPSHPLRHPPSPPLTLEQTLSIAPADKQSNSRPRTPKNMPLSSSEKLTFTPSPRNSPHKENNKTNDPEALQPTSIHLPFVLAYDSELLAKQFTLIEKDALLEIDWKELVELNWEQTDVNAEVKDWVELLNSKNIKGVEVVIARFNLMCKWARSEIVMTKDINERARTIVKFIHVAAHARKMHNYATMYQLTIALLTSDIARLRKTWDLVSAADMMTFRELETLVQPIRNFHHLRSEIDKVTGENGCIPFVGIFTHDLILNAQRPALMTGETNSEPLVNFERHRTTATVVKRLLRLIEASHKYTFEAVDGVCERCLWIASLSDDEIRALSKYLE